MAEQSPPRWFGLATSDLCLSTADFGATVGSGEPEVLRSPIPTDWRFRPEYEPQDSNEGAKISNPRSATSRYSFMDFDDSSSHHDKSLRRRNDQIDFLALAQEVRQRILIALVDDAQLLDMSLSALHALALDYAKVNQTIAEDLEYVLSVWIRRKSALTNFALHSIADTEETVRKHKREFHDAAIKRPERPSSATQSGGLDNSSSTIDMGRREGMGHPKAGNINLVSKMSLRDYRVKRLSKKVRENRGGRR